MAKSLGSVSSPREGKNVYTGVITKNHSQDDSEKPNLDIVFKVTERTSAHLGNPYLIPDIDIETY